MLNNNKADYISIRDIHIPYLHHNKMLLSYGHLQAVHIEFCVLKSRAVESIPKTSDYDSLIPCVSDSDPDP